MDIIQDLNERFSPILSGEGHCLHDKLLSKGFKLNKYPQGKFYELTAEDDNIISKILGEDYMGDEETIVLQLKEDFSNKILAVDCNVYDLTDKEFKEILNRI